MVQGFLATIVETEKSGVIKQNQSRKDLKLRIKLWLKMLKNIDIIGNKISNNVNFKI